MHLRGRGLEGGFNSSYQSGYWWLNQRWRGGGGGVLEDSAAVRQAHTSQGNFSRNRFKRQIARSSGCSMTDTYAKYVLAKDGASKEVRRRDPVADSCEVRSRTGVGLMRSGRSNMATGNGPRGAKQATTLNTGQGGKGHQCDGHAVGAVPQAGRVGCRQTETCPKTCRTACVDGWVGGCGCVWAP